MNSITKEVVKRILELEIEGIRKGIFGELYASKGNIIIGDTGDVNFTSWHENTLSHDCFKFSDTNTTTIKIETQEQADEFVDIVANYFGVEENEACELGTNSKDVEEALLEFSNSISEVDVLESNSSINYLSPIYRYNEEGELIQVLEIDKNDGLYKQVYPKLTAKERLEALYKEYLDPIVEELNKEYGDAFERRDAEIFNNKRRFVGHLMLNGKRRGTLSITMSHYFETPNYTPIEEVKVKKRFKVYEELCKIEMPGHLQIISTDSKISLKFKGHNIANIIGEDRGINWSKGFSKNDQVERYNKFGNELKPEQEKEFVQWIAETLGGTYEE